MRRATHRLVAVVAILIFCVAVAVPGAAAVDDPVTNETESEEPTYLIEIDDDVRVVDAEMVERDTMSITFEADRSTEIAITDASQEIQNMEAVQIRQDVRTLPEGTSEITFTVANADQPAVTIATQTGLVGIGDQDFDGDRPAVDWGVVQALLAATAIGSVGATYRIVKSGREDDEPEADRIL